MGQLSFITLFGANDSKTYEISSLKRKSKVIPSNYLYFVIIDEIRGLFIKCCFYSIQFGRNVLRKQNCLQKKCGLPIAQLQKNQYIIMLKQQQRVQELPEDPLANIFQQGVDEFILYQKHIPQQYKTKSQRTKEKIKKLERDMNDPQMKKQRNNKRRRGDKKKLHSILENMNHQEAAKFLEERKRIKKLERQRAKQAMQLGQVFMIDLVFEQKMNGKENKSLSKQIQLIFKGIKHVERPPSIHLCSFQGGIKQQLSKMGYQNWFMNTHLENIVEIGNKLGKKLIYLSPDAQLPLENVDQNCAYILGGLIDRTILKYASLCRARDLGIQARKLPIKQFMRSRVVLNLDHVILMVLKFRDCKDWKEAFDHAAPKRWKKDLTEKKQDLQKEQQQDNQQSNESNEKEELRQQFQTKVEINQNESI